MKLPVIFILYFLFCGLAGLLLWLKMLKILEEQKGYDFGFMVKPKQFFDFYKFIKKEKSTSKKAKYRIIFWSQILLIPLWIIGGFLLLAYSYN